MKAITIQEFNKPNNLIVAEVPLPEIQNDEVLIKVHYAGINRADLLQSRGLYPPPKGVTDIPGLEFSGEIIKCGTNVNVWRPGEKVCTIVTGGAYAEFLAVKSTHLIKIPANLSMAEAAALPEAFITSYQAMVSIAHLKNGEKVLIHAGASGVGSAAIQMAKHIGCHVITTVSESKHEYCYALGANECINYKTTSFKDYIKKEHPDGVNMVLDFIGASAFYDNIQSLGIDSRMVMLGFLGGTNLEAANIGAIVSKRLTITGSTLRNRNDDYKTDLIENFQRNYLQNNFFPFKCNVDRKFDFSQANEAHNYMNENLNKGKIVLKIL